MNLAKLISACACCLFLGAHAWAQVDIDLSEQQAFYAAAKRASESVVQIETLGGIERPGELTTSGITTSGVVVDSEGFIITSLFAFKSEPNSILVRMSDGRSESARIVARDLNRDLVLLKVDVDGPLNVPDFVPQSDIAVGQWAITVGRTLPGSGFNMSVGIVSAMGRVWGKAIQSDANISPANYGGALVDIQGRVLGVISPLDPDGNMPGTKLYDSGIGFAIPMQSIMTSLDRLKDGDLHPGKMGVSIKSSDLYSKPVVQVSRPKSPARDAGIEAGDLITGLNGIPIRTYSQMKHLLGPLLAGDRVTVDFERAGEELSRELVLTDKLEPYVHPFLGILPARQPIGADVEGVAIRHVLADSPADKAGLKVADVITKLNGVPAADADGLRTTLASVEPGVEVELVYLSGDDELTAKLTLANLPEDVPEELPPARIELEETNEELPPLGKIDVKLPEEEGDCIAYIPQDYDPRLEHSMLVLLPIPGEDASDMLAEWKDIADRQNVILVLPQSKDRRAWEPTETEFIRKTIENVRREYRVDTDRIVVYGEKTSGSMAWLTAMTHRDLIRGIASVGGPVPTRDTPPLFNEPLERLAAWVISAAKSRAGVQIKQNVSQLREIKIPVTHHEVETAEVDSDRKAELMRWLDTLDRI